MAKEKPTEERWLEKSPGVWGRGVGWGVRVGVVLEAAASSPK